MKEGTKLLTRNEFRDRTFARDRNRCVFCGDPAADAHHILDRKLFPDGGYYLNNGASVCNPCHLRCEDTSFTVEQVRERCGVTEPVLPPGFDADCTYDKWGNILTHDGRRIQGPLFEDTGVQTLLKREVGMYEHRVKYPRTYHFDWSLSLMNDDRRLETTADLEGHRVIVSEKYDGENTSLYADAMHARSLDSRHHGSRDWVKTFHGSFKHDIPHAWRVCVENTYATHSIKYRRALGNALPSFAMGLSVWDENNVCMAWDDTLVIFEALGITPVKVLYDGIYDEALLRKMALEQDPNLVEGYVCRRADAIAYDDFTTHVAKYVRAKHVRSSRFWRTEEIVPNEVVD